MPMPVSGIVGMPATPQTGPQTIRQDPLNSTVVTESNGKYYEATRNGLVFTTTTPAAGVAIVSYASTAAGFCVFNPPTSGKKMQLICCKIGYVSGTQTPGYFAYATNILGSSGVSGTAQTILNNNTLVGGGSAMQAFTTATVTAMQLFEPMGVSVNALTASAIVTPWTARDDIDGRIVINPGSAFNVAGSVAAFGTYVVSLSWIELPAAA